MASILLSDVNGIPNFDIAESTGISARWKRWLRAFQLYAVGKGVADADQKQALLLHTAGMSVQDIFFTLPAGAGDDAYVQTVSALDGYFTPQSNVPYERSIFRSMAQLPTETIEQYITRLRQRADTCDFGDQNAIDERIRDQIIDKCLSHHLRRKLLEKGRTLTLVIVRSVARAMEDSERQAKSIECHSTEHLKSDINRIQSKGKQFGKKSFNSSKKSTMCYSCGREGHIRTDPNCPARGKKCRKCKIIGHFEMVCKTKDKAKKIRQVVETDQEEYIFSVNQIHSVSKNIVVNIGGVDLEMIIDSGASCNIMGKHLWNHLKENRVKCVSSKSTKNLFAYGSQEPLKVAGEFTTIVKCNNRVLNKVDFVVIEGKGQALLSRDTAEQLGVLQLVHNVSESVTNLKSTIKDKFPGSFTGVGKLKSFKLKIPIDPDVEPVIQSMRRVPFNLRDKLAKKLDELLDLDIIECVNEPSEWVSPVVVVPKPSGDIRLCVDMRMANTAVKRVRHPIPTIDELLQEMNSSRIFSKLDVTSAYHQIELEPESREITTFVTHKGLFRYKRLMFGVSCAPELYQKVMQQVLQGCEGVHNIMDDIIVHASTQEEHDKCLENVVRVLQEKGITLNDKKCEFNLSKVVFMGHVLSDRGIGPADIKVKAVVEAREPRTSAEVRSFLGLVNYSARFIPDLATISAPLRALTRKHVIFTWGKEEKMSFNELKRCLANAETLGYYDKSAPTKVIADASPVGLGAVLVQEQRGEFRVISYASRSLSDTERRYSQTEKEALALVWACERFHIYIYGSQFELLTDHKPLECIFSPKSKVCARIERWVLRMQPYTYTVRYIPGPKNIADSLSRLINEKQTSGDNKNVTEEYIQFVAQESTPVAMTTREIEIASENDPELRAVRECLVNGQWHRIEFKEYLPIRNELCAIGKLVLRGTRIVIPIDLREHVLELAHEGHPGIVAMKTRLRSKIWWPGIDKSIQKFCQSCYGCQLVSMPSKPEPLKRTELPSAPWQHLAADLLGPLPSNHYILVLVDYYSRYFEVAVTKNISSENIKSLISRFCLTHGLPLSIHTDNGPQFVSQNFKNFMFENGIVHHRTTPLWPQANGEVERQNRSIMKRIKIAQGEGRDWKSELEKFLIMYRSTAHTTTGVCPSELLFGRKIRTKLPELLDYRIDDYEVRDRDAEKKEKGKIYADMRRGACESDIHAGDKVLVRQERGNKMSTPFKPSPFKVVEKTGNSVLVESGQGVQYRRNVTHLKRFIERENTPMTSLQHETDPNVGHTESEIMSSQKNDSENVTASCQSDEDQCLSSSQSSSQNQTCSTNDRPVRVKKLPSRFDDFVLK